MGRSRGGLTTKIHALVDANGLPIRLKLSAGQAHDARSGVSLLENLKQGQILLADRAYDNYYIRQAAEARGTWPNIKPLAYRAKAQTFSAFLYKERNRVERFFNKLKHFRAIATRFEKSAANYLNLVKLASIRLWLRFMSR